MAISKFYYPNRENRLHVDTNLGNTAVVVSDAAPTIYLVIIDNTANASPVYLKAYHNLNDVTPGTTVPDMILFAHASSKRTVVFPKGLKYGTGLQVRCVTAPGVTGTTSPASAVIAKILLKA